MKLCSLNKKFAFLILVYLLDRSFSLHIIKQYNYHKAFCNYMQHVINAFHIKHNIYILKKPLEFKSRAMLIYTTKPVIHVLLKQNRTDFFHVLYSFLNVINHIYGNIRINIKISYSCQ